MNNLSRKIVVIIIGLFLQSSLGTNAALKDFSNVSTKTFSQNGYYKLPDGLMIQWEKELAVVHIRELLLCHFLSIMIIIHWRVVLSKVIQLTYQVGLLII